MNYYKSYFEYFWHTLMVCQPRRHSSNSGSRFHLLITNRGIILLVDNALTKSFDLPPLMW